MSLDVNGYAVLRTIGAQPRLFPDIAVDAKKAARTLVVKQLRAKGTDAGTLAKIGTALGAEAFRLLLDTMSDAEVKSLSARLDRHHPEQKAARPGWHRQHLADLASGKAAPVTKEAGTARAAGRKAAGKKKPAKTATSAKASKSAKSAKASKTAKKRTPKAKAPRRERLFGKSMAAVRKR